MLLYIIQDPSLKQNFIQLRIRQCSYALFLGEFTKRKNTKSSKQLSNTLKKCYVIQK